MDLIWLRKQLTPSKLLFYTLFHALHVGIFVVGWWAQATNEKLAGLNTLLWSVWLSRGAGLVLSMDVTLILLPMCRNIMTWIRPKLRWLPLDETQFFHRNVAYSLLFWSCVHTTSHYVNFFNVEKNQVRPEAAVQIHYTQAGGITGHVMLICMLLMYTTAHNRIRSQSFETFWYTHHLFIPFLLAMYTHATGCFVRDSTVPYSPFAGNPFWNHCLGYEGWRWELVAAALYLSERLYREIRSRRATHITKVIRHPYDAVEIQFYKPSLRYKPGQWLFLNCPSVSPTQWHPFTITSCPLDPYTSVHVRQVGDFTRDLASALGAGPQQQPLYSALDPLGIYEITPSTATPLPAIRVDGPYGAPAEDVFDNEIALLIGTGIGVTPWASVLKNIWQLRNGPSPPRRLRRVEFIWVCRDTRSFEWFQALLTALESQSTADDSDFLRIHTYLTQRLDEDAAQNIVLNSVGAERDPLTQLNSRTNFGRPDFGRLFAAVRDGLVAGTYLPGLERKKKDSGSGGGGGATADVGVYFCGPNAAARDISKACRRVTGKGVRFKFWKEHY